MLKDPNEWKDTHIHRLEDLILSRWQYSKLIYTFGTTPIKSPSVFFTEIKKTILKKIWKCKGTRIAKQPGQRRTKLDDSHFQNLLQSYSNQDRGDTGITLDIQVNGREIKVQK